LKVETEFGCIHLQHSEHTSNFEVSKGGVVERLKLETLKGGGPRPKPGENPDLKDFEPKPVLFLNSSEKP
jgi:hypothetical protein